MRTYREILDGYRRRRHETVVDGLTVGLSFTDELMTAAGLLGESELLSAAAGVLCGAAPFAVIALHEGRKVCLGLKPTVSGMQDCVRRMVKTGAAMCLGSVVTAGAGPLAALQVTVGARVLLDWHKSRLLTDLRVQRRINRLQVLNRQLRDVQRR